MKAHHARLYGAASPAVIPSSALGWTSRCGVIGACIYLAGFALSLPGNLPLIALVLCSILVVTTSPRPLEPGWSPLTLAIVAFLCATVVSTVVSVDLDRSVQLSTPLLPAVLLFCLAEHCHGSRDIRRFYLTLSAVGLVLACLVLWTAWHAPGIQDVRGMRAVITSIRVPVLVVPNDLTFLAVVAPLSLVLFYREPRGGKGLMAAVSIILSLGAIYVVRSRTAALTIMLGLIGTAVLVQPRQRLPRSLVGVFALLGVALLVNALFFPESQVATRFAHDWTLSGRTTYWSVAWAMFWEAPLVGKGPHTFGLFHRTPWPHNLYLEVLAEQGLLGLAALGGLLVCGLTAGWTLRSAPSEDVRLYGMGALASLMGLCAAGVVELTLLREWVVTMLFMLLGIIRYLSAFQPQGERSGS